MATKDLGNKHLCTSCGAKFYDMGNLPPTCPKCETVIEVVVKPKPTRAAPKPMRAAPKPAEPAPSKEPEDVVDDDADDAPPITNNDKDDVNVLAGDKDRKD